MAEIQRNASATVGGGVVDVAVVIPVANRAAMLQRALRSVASQTVKPLEIIVVDDCSQDNSRDVAIANGARVVQMTTNGGPGLARNAGIEAATASWIAFLDSDDEWVPHHLEHLLSAAGTNDLVTAPAVTSRGRVIGNPWRRRVQLTPRRIFSPVELVCTSGTMVRRSACLAAGSFPAMRRSEDLDLWLRMLERGPGLALAVPTVRYALHDDQVSGDSSLMREASIGVMRQYDDRPWFGAHVQADLVARMKWDSLRAALRSPDLRTATRDTIWLALRPYTWLSLLQLFAARRLSRHPLPSDT